MELHFIANKVTDVKVQRACFLSWIGTETFELLQKLCDNDIGEKSLEDLVSKLNDHFVAKQHVLAARFKFYSIRMKSGQIHEKWVAEQRGAAKECAFICTKQGCNESFVDSHIRDMVIMHTPYDKVRSSALKKQNPTLDEVMQIAAL